MSTLLYGALTKARTDQQPGRSVRPGGKPGFGTYVDALSALVPAEVLALHAVLMPLVTRTRTIGGVSETAISDVSTLRWVFWALIAMSAFLYLLGRNALRRWDFVRMWIAPAAFVGWTMLQRPTAFDAVAPGVSDQTRFAAAVLGAVFLGAVAARLGYAADQSAPPQSPAQAAADQPNEAAAEHKKAASGHPASVAAAQEERDRPVAPGEDHGREDHGRVAAPATETA